MLIRSCTQQMISDERRILMMINEFRCSIQNAMLLHSQTAGRGGEVFTRCENQVPESKIKGVLARIAQGNGFPLGTLAHSISGRWKHPHSEHQSLYVEYSS